VFPAVSGRAVRAPLPRGPSAPTAGRPGAAPGGRRLRVPSGPRRRRAARRAPRRVSCAGRRQARGPGGGDGADAGRAIVCTGLHRMRAGVREPLQQASTGAPILSPAADSPVPLPTGAAVVRSPWN